MIRVRSTRRGSTHLNFLSRSAVWAVVKTQVIGRLVANPRARDQGSNSISNSIAVRRMISFT